jgi:AcrR family transcriptional regulator
MKRGSSHNSGRTPGRPRCSETDEAIIRATVEQLATEGYSRMSIDTIAERAGTTKPTIYRRWPSKADLAVAALSQLQAAGMPTPQGSLRSDLIAAMRDFQSKLLRPNGLAMIGTLLAEERHNPELISLFRQRIVGPRRRLFLAILSAAKDGGELRADVDLPVAVNMLVGSLYARYLAGDGIGDDWAERAVDTLLAGVARRA